MFKTYFLVSAINPLSGLSVDVWENASQLYIRFLCT